MALNYDSITSIVVDEYIPQMIDNITEESALLAMLVNDGRVMSAAGRMSSSVSGGTKIIQPLRYDLGDRTHTYSGFDTVDITPRDPRTAAEYTFGRYVTPISISDEDEEKVNGDNAVIQLISDEMETAELDMKKKLYTDIYNGSGANSIIGLDTAIGTGTYGGIDGATYTWWQSGVDTTAHTTANMKDSTNASYIITLLQTGFLNAKHTGMKPNLILVSQKVFDILDSVSETDQQFTVPTGSRNEKVASLGFTVLFWRNIPVVVDDTISNTDNPMYMINTNDLTLYYHPMNNFKLHPWLRPIDQMAKYAHISVTLQLAIRARRLYYRWSDLGN